MKSKTASRVMFLAFFVFLMVLWWWRLRLGMIRYFDYDEYQYAHWAYNLFKGERPYIDFFLYISPVYLYVISVLYHFFGGIMSLVAGRLLAFGLFVMASGLVGYLFFTVKKSWLAILPPVILAVLPLPSDKFIEIRPDVLMVDLLLLSLIFQVRWLHKQTGLTAFLSGLFMALAVLVSQKAFVWVFVAGLIMLLGLLIFKRGGLREWWQNGAWFATGLIGPFLLFGLWAVHLGDFGQVWYSLVKLPFEVYSGWNSYSWYFYFLDNDVYFGHFHFPIGLVVNHTLWALSLGLAICFMLRVFARGRSSEERLRELLFGGIFLAYVVYYIFFLRLKYLQFLIPPAIFVSWYVSDGLRVVYQVLGRIRKGWVVMAVGCAGLLCLLGWVFLDVHQEKLRWTNYGAFEKMEEIWRTIPKSEYIFDLQGATLYYPDPYFLCCTPYGQFNTFLTRKLPPLAEALEGTKTHYVFQSTGLLDQIPQEDRAFILAHYSPVGDGMLLKTTDW